MERSIMKVKVGDRIQIKQIKKKLGQKEVFVMAAKRLKWDWVGHEARQNQDRWDGKNSKLV